MKKIQSQSDSVMAITDKLFIPNNLFENIPEERYKQLDGVINFLDVLTTATYRSIYIIDNYKQNFLYVSGNPLFLCGHTPEEVKKMGFDFYAKYIPENELKMIIEINKSFYSFIHKFPAEERSNFFLAYDFHLCTSNRKKKLVNHKIIPFLPPGGNSDWLTICIVSVSPNKTAGNAFIQDKYLSINWVYNFEKHNWKEKKIDVLDEREKEILLLSAQGFTMNEIADKLCLAIDTVKLCKRKLFQKINVTNISEALFLATNHRLI